MKRCIVSSKRHSHRKSVGAVARSCTVMAEKATGPFETQGGKEKFPVGVGGKEEGRKS